MCYHYDRLSCEKAIKRKSMIKWVYFVMVWKTKITIVNFPSALNHDYISYFEREIEYDHNLY